jgi:hypothetical protein
LELCVPYQVEKLIHDSFEFVLIDKRQSLVQLKRLKARWDTSSFSFSAIRIK